MSTTSHIVSLLIEERDKLDAVLKILRGSTPVNDDPPEWVTSPTPLKTTTAAPAPKKRKVSAAARKRMAEGQKKRWAAINAAKAETIAPKAKAAKKKVKAIIAEAIAPKADEDFKSKMSIAMAKSWAKRRAAAKKKTAKA
jgi:hypothetical protein